MKKSVALALVLVSGSFTGKALAATDGSVLLPNTFTAGTPALAEQVNANFAALQNAVNASNSRLTTAEGTIVSKQNRVSGACASGYAIQAINADGSVLCQPDTNSGGDITGVIAGSGLSGGGTTGDVALFIPDGAITSSHIANGSVGTLAIANGAVASGNLAAGAVGAAAIADGVVSAVKIADEPGITYTGVLGEGLALSTCNTTTMVNAIAVNAPSSGYIYVSASGSFCTYTGGVSSTLVMDDAPPGSFPFADGGNWVHDYRAVARVCAEAEQTPFNFQNVYQVAGPGLYTYYLNACVSAAGNQTLFATHPMIGMYFPTHY